MPTYKQTLPSKRDVPDLLLREHQPIYEVKKIKDHVTSQEKSG
jgi:hypothetical protein